MLPLHITRVRSDCSLHFKIRPFSTFRHLLWPLLTSPLPSPAVADALPGNFPGETETSLGKTLIFPPVAAEFTCAMSERLSGLTIPCWLTPSHRPCIRFLSVRAGFCLQLPPHPVSRRRSCLQLTIPVVTARRELSPLRSVPCQAHMGSGLPLRDPRNDGKVVNFTQCNLEKGPGNQPSQPPASARSSWLTRPAASICTICPALGMISTLAPSIALAWPAGIIASASPQIT